MDPKRSLPRSGRSRHHDSYTRLALVLGLDWWLQYLGSSMAVNFTLFCSNKLIEPLKMIKSVTHQHIATGVMSRLLVWCLEKPEKGRDDKLGLGSPYSIAQALCFVCTNRGRDPGAKNASPSRMRGRRPAVGVNEAEWATPSKFRPPSPAPFVGRYGGGNGSRCGKD
jgi:hypothetical protein